MSSGASGANQDRPGSTASSENAGMTHSSQSQGRTGACHPCRTRKVKCDRQEVCSRCTMHGIQCVYDENPNRRGPDRTPRRRRRSRLQLQRQENEHNEPSSSRSTRNLPPPQPRYAKNLMMVAFVPPAQGRAASLGSSALTYQRDQDSLAAEMAPPVETMVHPVSLLVPSSTQEQEVDQDITLRSSHSSNSSAISHGASGNSNFYPSPGLLRSESSSISSTPSLQFYRKTWWDTLLRLYSPIADDAVRSIYRDLNVFFGSVSPSLSFLHVPTFLENVFGEQTRERMQPSLILSLLALSSVMQAQPSKLDLAIKLHSWSHSAFDASINASWMDIQLAQAAILICVFEATPQRLQDYDRLNAVWTRIDALTTALDLHNIDAGNRDVFVIERSAQSGTYLDSLCRLNMTTPHPADSHPHLLGSSASPLGPNFNPSSTSTCSCRQSATMTGALWFPRWHENWSLEEIQREERRRVFWTAFCLIAYGLSHQIAHGTPRSRFRVANLPHIAVCLPGEALHSADGFQPSAKTTIWALHARAHLLWVAATQLDDASAQGLVSPEMRAPIAAEVWLEMERLTLALDEHRCGIETTQMFTIRYYLQLSRMIATKNFSQHIPSAYAGVPQRRETEDWIARLKLFIDPANAPEEKRHNLMRNVAQNPWTVWLLVDQTQRCLDLWNNDRSLHVALDVANRMQPALWAIIRKYKPAPFLERFGNEFKTRLRNAMLQG